MTLQTDASGNPIVFSWSLGDVEQGSREEAAPAPASIGWSGMPKGTVARVVSSTSSQQSRLSDLKEKKRAVCQRYHTVTANHWTWELIGIAVCLICVIVIITVLSCFNNSPTPHAVSGISLNTVIAILATVSRTTAVFVAASVVAQQKWIRFTDNPRSLIEMLLYDDATRGPFGSLYLLATLRLSFVAALGAIVAMLTLGFEPFVQQTIKFSVRDQLMASDVQSRLPIVQNVSFSSQNPFDLDVALAAVVSRALYEDSPQVSHPVCPGSSCDWVDYQSAAICSKCEDALDDVIIEAGLDAGLLSFVSDDFLHQFDLEGIDFGTTGNEGIVAKTWITNYNVSLGQGAPITFNITTSAWVNIDRATNGSLLNHTGAIIWDLYGTPDTDPLYKPYHDEFWDNITINGVLSPIKALGYVNLTASIESPWLVATEAKRCIISLCAQQSTSKLEGGKLTTNVTQTEWGSFQVQNNLNWRTSTTLNWTATLPQSDLQFQANCTENRQRGEFVNHNPIITVLTRSLSRTEGELRRQISRPGTPMSTAATITSADFVRAVSDFEHTIAKLAQGLTAFIQQNGDSEVSGQAYLSKTFLNVNWIWLTLPVILVVTVLAALIATMSTTKQKRLPIWKSSPFPLLYNFSNRSAADALRYSLIDNESNVAPSAMTSWHEEMAEKTYVQLKSNAGTWFFERAALP